ncbi:MAG: hypothetical protein OXG88_11715 [Gammaproteobacteria bacterium]|nr:hypothetical protein [Gammaproteobacteria bacterium]
MKTHRWIAVLIILTSASIYAEVYRGYQTEGDKKCTGEFVIAGSIKELEKYDNQNDDWTLRSYKRVVPPGVCEEYTGTITIEEGDTIITPSLLDDPSAAPAVVFIPTPFPVPMLSSDFDAKKNQKLLDSWQPRTSEIPPIAAWIGTETDTMWTHITPYEWEITREPGDGSYAKLISDEKPYKIKIYIENIYRAAQANNLPPEHLIIQAQMEEHIHAIQLDAEENDGDKLRKLTLADEFAVEMEAKLLIQEIIWPYLYGMQPPYLMRLVEKPDDYDQKRDEYNDLWVKEKQQGLNILEQYRLYALEKYFKNDVPKVTSYPNPRYEGESNTGDEEETE